MFTSDQAIRINKMSPAAERDGLGDEVKRLGDTGAFQGITLVCNVVADATGGKAVPIPYAMEVLDVCTQCRAANANGTMKIKKGASDITDAMICAVDKVVTRAGTIDDAQSTLAAGDTVTVVAAQAGDRGLITIFGRLL